jgi:hypothetical protein
VETEVVDRPIRAQLPPSWRHTARGVAVRGSGRVARAAPVGRYIAAVGRGSIGVLHSISADGFLARCWDDTFGLGYDITSTAVRRRILTDIRTGKVVSMFVSVGRLPATHEWIAAVVEVLTYCHHRSVRWLLLAPGSSSWWSAAPVAGLSRLDETRRFDSDLCAFGGRGVRRRYTFLSGHFSDPSDLERLARTCRAIGCRCQYTRRPHAETSGDVSPNAGQQWPPRFRRAIAHVLIIDLRYDYMINGPSSWMHRAPGDEEESDGPVSGA